MQALVLSLLAMLAPQGDSSTSHNVLVVLLDDVGVDQLRATADPSVDFPFAYDTPNLDAIAAKGVSFTNAWANPLCSPTRATIQTGLYAFRPGNGIGQVIEKGCCNQFGGVPCREANNCCRGCPNWSLRYSGNELPHKLPGYLSGAFGKWHLEDKHQWNEPVPLWPEMTRRDRRLVRLNGAGHRKDQTGPNLSSPCAHGYDFFAGTLWQVPWFSQPQCENHLASGCQAAEGADYCTWGMTTLDAGQSGHSRQVTVTTDYMPGMIAETAKNWISSLQTLQPGVPWFCYLAPQAPFQLGHVPPAGLQDVVVGASCTKCSNADRDCYLAALEAFDTRLGQVLAQIGTEWWLDTTVIFLGDNGTPQLISQVTGYWPEGRAKTTLFNGGVNVPMFVAGKAVDASLWGTTSAELVNSVDVYATVVELAGGTPPAGIDGISLAPFLATTGSWPRTWIYAEKFEPNGRVVPQGTHEVAIRDARYKLIRKCWDHSQDQFYDLQVDPKELSPLAIPQLPSDPLYAEFTALVSSLPSSCP